MRNKLQAYRHADTMGKPQLELILMVYDGAIKALNAATEYYRGGDMKSGYDQIQTAKRMVTHLYTTLDEQKGGQVARYLGRMYTWIMGQLFTLEATKDLSQIEAVVKVLDNLRSGWAALKKKPAAAADQKPKSAADSPVDTPDHITVMA